MGKQLYRPPAPFPCFETWDPTGIQAAAESQLVASGDPAQQDDQASTESKHD